MAHRDHLFPVTLEHPLPGEGWYTLAGTRYGPFRDPDQLDDDLATRVRGWDRYARRFGGWAVRRGYAVVVVTLPDPARIDADGAPWVRALQPQSNRP
ncbi:MAG: hypothetical protein ABMA64_30540 [Myxococcota bacterium]